jgi:SAM-dependent methyltransferase
MPDSSQHVPRVDYDAIAADYHNRYEHNSMPGIAAWLTALAQRHSGAYVLEVGCGTGRWLAQVRPHAGWVAGLDRSPGMLRHAHTEYGMLPLICGAARRLPFPTASFDVVMSVHALHHFDDPMDFMREAVRVLRPGGVLALVGMVRPGSPDDWYVYQYFEGAYETDRARFPAWDSLMGWLVDAGFETVEGRVVEYVEHSHEGRAVLDDPFLAKHATSQLSLLSNEAYERGMSRIREAVAVAEAADEPLVFPTSIRMRMLIGTLAD